MSTQKVFRARTNEGFLFKVLAELLQHNIKSCCLILQEEGISLQMTDNLMKVLVNVRLDKDKFNVYKFKFDQKKIIGINLSHFYKMLKSVKKKDTVELFIENEEDFNFGIEISPKDNSRTTTSFIKIQNIQNIQITMPDGYENCVVIPSGEFHKMIKDMIHIGNVIQITSTVNTVLFKCIADGIFSRQVVFGEKEEEEEQIFDDEFATEQLNKIIKISGLSNKLYIYTQNNLPLLFKTNIGSLGEIKLFLKNNKEEN